MDRRWIAILIIIVLAVICGYVIVSSSNTVGNAIVDVNKSTATLPPGFSVGDSEKNSVELYVENSTKRILIEDLGKGDTALSEADKTIKILSDEDTVEFIDDTTNITENYKLYTIYYHNSDYNQSLTYLYSNNHTYMLKCSGFSSISEMNEDITFLADTIKLDYKKSQE